MVSTVPADYRFFVVPWRGKLGQTQVQPKKTIGLFLKRLQSFKFLITTLGNAIHHLANPGKLSSPVLSGTRKIHRVFAARILPRPGPVRRTPPLPKSAVGTGVPPVMAVWGLLSPWHNHGFPAGCAEMQFRCGLNSFPSSHRSPAPRIAPPFPPGQSVANRIRVCTLTSSPVGDAPQRPLYPLELTLFQEPLQLKLAHPLVQATV